ncbi:MAG: hypothetical protein MUE51_14130 [Thermoleophilia bacterium]|jgi:hypothetical protein|nr:hypothetical protein [Thermoleophilia bacterium]
MRTRIVLAVAAVALAPGAAAAATPAGRAAAWLERTAPPAAGGQAADAVVALAAAGRPPARLRPRLVALARVAPGYAVTAGAAGKVALAAVAAGGDPRRLGGVDYLARIRRAYAAGRYGATAYDQALAMLALRAAGEPVPPGAVSALRAARGPGGWNLDLRPRAADDVSTTGLVIEAMRASGVPAGDPGLGAALAWLTDQRNRAGGYAFAGAGGPTEANSTAFAIRAHTAMGRPAPARTRAALAGLQRADGGVDFAAGRPGSRLIATTDALVAFAGRALPPPFPAR